MNTVFESFGSELQQCLAATDSGGKLPKETTLAPGCIWVPYVQPKGPFRPRKYAPVKRTELSEADEESK